MCRRKTAICAALLLLAAFAPRATPQKTLEELRSEYQRPQTPEGEKERWDALTKFPEVKEDPKDDPLRKLLKERYNTAISEMFIRLERVPNQETPDLAIQAAQRVVEAGLELFDKPADQLALLEKHAGLANYLEMLVRDRVNGGVKCFTMADAYQARYARQTAEIRLVRLQQKMAKAAKMQPEK